MVMLTIIVPTIGRTDELIQLFKSIERQWDDSLEIVLVDQNAVGFIQNVLSEDWLSKITYIHSEKKGASHARNLGLEKATGKYINFCDDDAVLEKDFLSSVIKGFEKYSNAAMISFRVFDLERDEVVMLPFPSMDCKIDKKNFHSVTIEISQVWKADEIKSLDGFDPMLGVGSPYGAEEAKDLMVRALDSGLNMYYIAETCFRHPSKKDAPAKRYFSYAEGTASLAVKHYNKPHVCIHVLMFAFKSLLGVVIYNFWDRKNSYRYFMRFAGLISGFYKRFKGVGSK